jgi:membrane protein implicated in regulation of membrane protease activity
MHPALLWMIAGLALLIVELVVGSFFLMWIGAGALLTALLAVFLPTAWVQWLFFALASLVLLLATRPLARTLHGRTVVPSNVDSLKGQEAMVLEEINTRQNTGRVRVRSDEWRARSTEVIAPGRHVIIYGIEGTTLQVHEADVLPEPEA